MTTIPASFSLLFAVPSLVNGEDILMTTPGKDGTIGGKTPDQTSHDGIVRDDSQEDDDE